jgi:hypothetical protein
MYSPDDCEKHGAPAGFGSAIVELRHWRKAMLGQCRWRLGGEPAPDDEHVVEASCGSASGVWVPLRFMLSPDFLKQEGWCSQAQSARHMHEKEWTLAVGAEVARDGALATARSEDSGEGHTEQKWNGGGLHGQALQFEKPRAETTNALDPERKKTTHP